MLLCFPRGLISRRPYTVAWSLVLPDRRCYWWGRSTSTPGRGHTSPRAATSRPQLAGSPSRLQDWSKLSTMMNVSVSECRGLSGPLRLESAHNSGDNQRGKHQASFVLLWLMETNLNFKTSISTVYIENAMKGKNLKIKWTFSHLSIYIYWQVPL